MLAYCLRWRSPRSDDGLEAVPAYCLRWRSPRSDDGLAAVPAYCLRWRSPRSDDGLAAVPAYCLRSRSPRSDDGLAAVPAYCLRWRSPASDDGLAAVPAYCLRWRSPTSDDEDEFAAVPAYCLRSRSSARATGGGDDFAVLVDPEELVYGEWARLVAMGDSDPGRFLWGSEPPSDSRELLGRNKCLGKVLRYSSSCSSTEPASEDRLGRRSGEFGAVSTVGCL